MSHGPDREVVGLAADEAHWRLGAPSTLTSHVGRVVGELGQEVGLVLTDLVLQRGSQLVYIARGQTHHARLE